MCEVNLVPLFRPDLGPPHARRIIVDSYSACLAEAGELRHLRDHTSGLRTDDYSFVELGHMLDEQGRVRGEATGLEKNEVTVLFVSFHSSWEKARAQYCITNSKSVGMGLMDSAISALVLRKAVESGIGGRVAF